MGYNEDFAAAMKKQTDLIVQQVFIELIQVVAESETYEEFRKRMYGIALGYVKDLEAEGIKVPEQSKPKDKVPPEDKNMFIL